jgi:hypothetical protein
MTRGKFWVMRNFIWLPVLLATGFLTIPAMAQQGPMDTSNIRAGAPKAPSGRQQPETAPPSAVPGAVARPDSVAPADRAAADLPPTEGLFDAINRGDISAARDALSRGADLDGTNLLGLTPLELSVDLGRNDISFLLLSMRGGGGSSRRSGASADGAPPPQTKAQIAADRRKADRAAKEQAAASAAAVRRSAVAVERQQAPALFAGNGGAAVPSAGFLGFDPHH